MTVDRHEHVVRVEIGRKCRTERRGEEVGWMKMGYDGAESSENRRITTISVNCRFIFSYHIIGNLSYHLPFFSFRNHALLQMCDLCYL